MDIACANDRQVIFIHLLCQMQFLRLEFTLYVHSVVDRSDKLSGRQEQPFVNKCAWYLNTLQNSPFAKMTFAKLFTMLVCFQTKSENDNKHNSKQSYFLQCERACLSLVMHVDCGILYWHSICQVISSLFLYTTDELAITNTGNELCRNVVPHYERSFGVGWVSIGESTCSIHV